MPAIVRVKRRIDEEPLNAFVLNGKKRRLNEQRADGAAGGQDDAKDEISINSVLKFAGTIKEPDNTATTQFAQRLTKNEAKDLVQTKSARKAVNLTERARQEMRNTAQENRFRVVNCLRTILPENENDNIIECGGGGGGGDDGNAAAAVTNKTEGIATTSKSLTIVDIEKNTNETDAATAAATTLQATPQSQPADSDTGYVYDLYIPDDDVQARNSDLMDDNYLSVYGMQDIIFEDAYNDPHDDEDYDTEDSNREDYFTNDYPDDDDELHSANDYDDDEDYDGIGSMRRAIEKFVLDDDDSNDNDSDQDYHDGLSTDDEAAGAYEDPYLQSVDTGNENFVPDIDAVDVSGFPEAYHRYRQHSRDLRRKHSLHTFEELDHEDSGKDEAEFYTFGEHFNEHDKHNRSSDSENYHSADEDSNDKN